MEPAKSGTWQTRRSSDSDAQLCQLQKDLKSLRKRTEKAENELNELREFIWKLGEHGGLFVNELIALIGHLELELEQSRKVPEARQGAHISSRSPSPGPLSFPTTPDQQDVLGSQLNGRGGQDTIDKQSDEPCTPPRIRTFNKIPQTPRPPFSQQPFHYAAAVKPATVNLKRSHDRTEFGSEGERKESFAVPDKLGCDPHVARSIKRSRRTDSMKPVNTKMDAKDPRRRRDTVAL